MTRIVLIRHGHARAAINGVVGGHRGCRGLTDTGREQAQRLRDRLVRSGEVRPDVVLASALPRAIETAAILAPALGVDATGIAEDCDLCELHPGDSDGLTWQEAVERFGPWNLEEEPDRPLAPGGESLNAFRDRVGRTMRRLAAEHEGNTVVAVCHGGVVVNSLLSLFDIPRPGTRAALDPANTSITEWEHDGGRWLLARYGDTAHLAV